MFAFCTKNVRFCIDQDGGFENEEREQKLMEAIVLLQMGDMSAGGGLGVEPEPEQPKPTSVPPPL